METIYKSDFFQLGFDKSQNFLESSWLEKNVDMTEDQMKKEIETASSFIKKYKPLFILTDDRKRTFIYTVDTQSWVAKTLSKACAEAGIEKFAVLLPEEIVAQMSTEQTADEVANLPYELKMFFDKKEALKWIGI